MYIEPEPIRSDVQLLVEGRDYMGFFEALIEHLALENVQIQNFGGVDDLRRFLPVFAMMSRFSRVTSVGIVRDAERDAAGAFASVQSSLREARLPVPDAPLKRAGERPSASVMILPGDNQAGMLETLLCASFAGEPVDTCIEALL